MSGLAFGMLPAFLASKTDLDRRLRENSRSFTGNRHHIGLRQLLVGVEVALAVVLLIAAGLLGKSFWRLIIQDIGMDQTNVLTVSISSDRGKSNATDGIAFRNQVIDRVENMPGILSASYGTPREGSFAGIILERGSRPRNQTLFFGTVAPTYFEALHISLLKGRSFTDDEANAVVINERMASEIWPDRDPIGERFVAGSKPSPENPWLTVVGVVRNFKVAPGADEIAPWFFGTCGHSVGSGVSFSCSGMNLIVRANVNPVIIIPLVRSSIAEIDPNATITSVQTSEQALERTLAAPRFRTALLSIFGGVALLLSLVGIYGVTAYSAACRVQELGLRIALGATRSVVLNMMLRQTLVPVFVGIATGLAGAFGVMRVLSAYLFQVTTTDPSVFALVPLLVLFTAVVASFIPLRHGTDVDPVLAIRHE